MSRFCMFKAVASVVILIFISTFVALVIVRSLDRNEAISCSNFLKQRQWISINDDKCTPIKTTIGRSSRLDFPGVDAESERKTSDRKKMNGIFPVHYNWKTMLNNQTNFEGETSIIILVTIETNTIHINVDFEKIKISTSSIILFRCSNVLEYLCPEEITEYRMNQVLVLNFSRSLTRDVPYVLRFGHYFGTVNEGDGGLILRTEAKNSWAVTSLFQMRNARMAYPCFDQPSLKATFDICVAHSLDTIARSNMEIEQKESHEFAKMRLDCFKRTPKISTYVTAIAVLANFSEFVDSFQSPIIELFFSNSQSINQYVWQINETRQILRYIKETFNLSYDLSKLGIINVYYHPHGAIENIGLITVTGRLMITGRDESYRILTHEIVHHWIGNLVTIKNWQEICVQEGFTSYLTDLVVKHLHPIDYGSYSSSQYNMQRRNLYSIASGISYINVFNSTDDIADTCFIVPETFFRMINSINDFWRAFVKTLVQKYSFKNADLTDWGKILEEKSGNEMYSLSLKSAFHSAGFPPIYGQMLSNSSLNVQYRTLGKTIIAKIDAIPLQVSSGSYLSEIIFVNESNQIIDVDNVLQEKWFMIDPNFNIFGRKYYSPENYLALIECYTNEERNSCQINFRQFHEIFEDFCNGILQNILPWELELNFEKLLQWKSVLEKLFRLKKRNLWSTGNNYIDWECVCCIKNKTDIVHFESEMCPYHMLEFEKDDCICNDCDKLRICSTKSFLCEPNEK